MNRIIAILVILLIGAAIGLIFHQQKIRKLNIELDKVKSQLSDLKVENQRLELQNTKENVTIHLQESKIKEEDVKPKPVVKKPDSSLTTKVMPPLKKEKAQ